jgi:hypothetical protein
MPEGGGMKTEHEIVKEALGEAARRSASPNEHGALMRLQSRITPDGARNLRALLKQ